MIICFRAKRFVRFCELSHTSRDDMIDELRGEECKRSNRLMMVTFGGGGKVEV